jgi:small subunit ribosomal protein S5
MAKNYSTDNNQNNDSEIKEVLVSINRVAKVVKGGRRFSFAAVVVVGDGKGRVGFGLGKAKEVMDAKTKAAQEAKKSMIRVFLREGRTLHHDLVGHFGAGKVVLRSAKPGTGIIAGGPMRAIFDALGVHDIVAKSTGSSNVHNMVRATFDALNNLSSPKQVAERRGKKIGEIIERRESVEVRK